MCGVNACVHRAGGRADENWIAVANRLLAHRGPDGSGRWAEGSVALGHTRLSIVDIAHGIQPLFNEDRSLALVCNGEIYNSPVLRRELMGRGHSFATGSDCEVILHLYEEDPVGFLERLVGMFAFVLVDRTRGRVILGRDRLGIKPLFLALTEDWLLASSEIKTILRHAAIRPKLDAQVVADTMALGFAPGPRTVFEGVDELPPATCLTYDLATRAVKRRVYWVPDMSDRSAADADALRQLLSEVVRDHCLGDVPAAVYASGGLDSSVIAALLAEGGERRPSSFSLVFPDSPFDESPYIDELVRHVPLTSHRVPVERWALPELERALYHLEQPQIVTLDIAQIRLSAAVRDAGFKFVLGGDGPDELLGGYDHFAVDGLRRRLASADGSVPLSRLAELDTGLATCGYLPDFRERYMHTAAHEAPAVIEQFGVFPPWYVIWRAHEEISRPLLVDTGRDTLGPAGPLAAVCGPLHGELADCDELDKAVYLETRSRLPSWILWKADRNGMANSVEARVPYLDNRVVELLHHVPAARKSASGETKLVLRRACGDLIPRRIARRAKFAFNTPSEWLLTGSPEALSDLLSEASLRDAGLFEPTAVRTLLDGVRGDAERHDSMLQVLRCQVLVGVVTTQILHRLFVDTT